MCFDEDDTDAQHFADIHREGHWHSLDATSSRKHDFMYPGQAPTCDGNLVDSPFRILRKQSEVEVHFMDGYVIPHGPYTAAVGVYDRSNALPSS